MNMEPVTVFIVVMAVVFIGAIAFAARRSARRNNETRR